MDNIGKRNKDTAARRKNTLKEKMVSNWFDAGANSTKAEKLSIKIPQTFVEIIAISCRLPCPHSCWWLVSGLSDFISYVINSNGWLVFSLLVIRNEVMCFSLTGDRVKRLWLHDVWGGDPRGWKTQRTMGTFFTLSNSAPHESEIIQGYQVIK